MFSQHKFALAQHYGTIPISISDFGCVNVQDHFRPVTGLPISTYFSSYKLKWLIDNVPKVSKAISSEQAYLGK